MRTFITILACILFSTAANAFTRQDTLRGSNGTGRNWWDVQRYDLAVKFDTARRSITGSNTITLTVTQQAGDSLQLDLQEPMFLDSVVWQGQQVPFAKEGNVWWLTGVFPEWAVGSTQELKIYYHGRPHEAKNAPWDGGFIWARDEKGNPWIAVAVQGFGASSWWPCKDYQGDEPDKGMGTSFTVPAGMTAVGNGKLLSHAAATNTFTWSVVNPINTYNSVFYIGNYTSWTDTLQGEKGTLQLSYWVLKQNEAKARKQFAVVKQMLHCFEYWMGPYPFYEDGYKLVDAPYLGMEHQSAVAYGNEYKMGYLGRDRSGTGVGLLFDYIIVHESGHEWFGNNITAQDPADNWIHEGITSYSETLFAECIAGREKAFTYERGKRRNIMNNIPVIGKYGVNDDGSGDKYDKGAAMMHMVRVMMGDDEKFRQLMRGMGADFYHKIVTSAAIENYIMSKSGLQLQPFFDQYLRTTQIPKLEFYVKNKQAHYRFTNTVPGFSLPLRVFEGKTATPITVTTEWQTIKWKKRGFNVTFIDGFLIDVQ